MKILPITPLKATQTNNIGFFGKKSVLNLSKDMTDLSFYASSEPIEQRHYAFNIPDDKFVEFQIDKSTLENLLSVNNQPNEVLVTKFVLTYKDLALSKNEQYKRELAYYSDLYKRKELTEISKPILSAQEVEEIYAEEFSYPHKDELSMLRGYISKLYGPSMLAEILDVESAIRDWQKNIYSDSYDATTRIFQMCKHPYYMEFKDMDKKALAVDKIEQYIRHTSDKYIDNEQVDKVYSEILSAALNNDGSYDYELIN
ncbi:hypothetical protein IJ670_00675, partial [bacterium]|nr:hypothetical protein [bacterium]